MEVDPVLPFEYTYGTKWRDVSWFYHQPTKSISTVSSQIRTSTPDNVHESVQAARPMNR